MKDISENLHLEHARLQKEIESYIGLGGTSLIFDYYESDNKTTLNLITVNPKHRQSFLFHSVSGYDKVDALKQMLDYVKNYKERESSYTIQWALKDQKELNTSYFSAKNINAALDKLYFGRDPNSIVVFSVVMNPIA
jgi:hypothetical protein